MDAKELKIQVLTALWWKHDEELKEGALRRDDRLYFVDGCFLTEYRANNAELVRGNPVDILGDYIQRGDYCWQENPHPHTREMQPIKEGDEVTFSTSKLPLDTTYRLEKGVLVSQHTISERTAPTIDDLRVLKTESGFLDFARRQRGSTDAQQLTKFYYMGSGS